jgi:hypothetical protein
MSLKRCCCVFAMKKVGLREIEGHRRGRRAPAFAEYPYSLPGTWLKLIADMAVGPRPRNLTIGQGSSTRRRLAAEALPITSR